MKYHCEATSVEGFIQQLACNYLPHGYWFYVTGFIPADKDPHSIDQKLIEKYGIGVSRTTRARRKQAGNANLHYLRFERFFLLLATHGQHRFFDEEGAAIRDVRRIPIRFAGYSLTVKKGQYLKRLHPVDLPATDGKYRIRVRIAMNEFTELKAYFRERAFHNSEAQLAAELYQLPFEPYAPIRQQLLNLVRIVNRDRKQAGQEEIPYSAIRMRRRIVKPFAVLPISVEHGLIKHSSKADNWRGGGVHDEYL